MRHVLLLHELPSRVELQATVAAAWLVNVSSDH